MSAEEVRKQVKKVQNEMTESRSTSLRYSTATWEVTKYFLQDVSLLQEKYGSFLGEARAKHSDYLEKLEEIDGAIRDYFEYLTKSPKSDYCFKLVNLAIGKISELLSFVEGLDALPPQKKVSKKAYKLVKENDTLKKMIEIMVKYKGLPELNDLLEKARNVKLPTDEHWVLALCSVNLIEATVNKKLEELKEPTEGTFEKKYKRLRNIIKEKEQRDIQQLLPLALYKGIRNKLDHASHANRVTPKEAKDISKLVIGLIMEILH